MCSSDLDGEAVVLGDELDRRAGGAGHLAAATGLQLDVVHQGARRDVVKRERVARLDVSLGAGLDGRADAEPLRRDDVGLGAVGVVEQRDPGRPVGVVLDRGDLRRDAVLLALEVDDAVLALVAATLMACGDAAAVVAATGLLDRKSTRLNSSH